MLKQGQGLGQWIRSAPIASLISILTTPPSDLSVYYHITIDQLLWLHVLHLSSGQKEDTEGASASFSSLGETFLVIPARVLISYHQITWCSELHGLHCCAWCLPPMAHLLDRQPTGLLRTELRVLF